MHGRVRALAWIGVCLVLCVGHVSAAAASDVHDPVADPASVVETGLARFTILTPRLIRMEHSATRTFEDRASLAFINRSLPVPEFTAVVDDGWLKIETDSLVLSYRVDANAFTSETLKVDFGTGDAPVQWAPGLSDKDNLKGTTRTLDAFDGDKHYRTDRPLELEKGVVSRAGWSLIDDSASLLFDGDPADNVLAARGGEGATDWYLFAYGHDYKGALGDFVQVAGRIPMPPRYAFGYWWSRYWSYSDRELRDLVETVEDYDIPLDVLVVDMDWHETFDLTSKNPKTTPFGGMLGWTGYSWNRDLFPDPGRFLDWTEEQGLKVALNLHPADGVAPHETSYVAFRQAAPPHAPMQDGWYEYAMSDPDWAKAYFSTLLRPHETLGVDFWWLDWQQWTESRFVSGLNNTFWLNHVFFHDMAATYPDRRPLLFHRWGGLGNHRYQVGFSGDVVISWESLALQPGFTATASNVGYGYWSHDIGGHIDAHPELANDGELYLRWLQFGALSPILRSHSSKSDQIERRIWKYPDHFNDMRDAIRLRHALVPYVYRYAREAYDSGVSIIRPMYYDYPQTDAAYDNPQQYMIGTEMIVAPVTSPVGADGLAQQTIWLPPGQWYERNSGTRLEGGVHRRSYALDEIPLFVRDGAIIPLNSSKIRRADGDPNTLILWLTPGLEGAGSVYEDDGRTPDYQAGDVRWTHVESRWSGHDLILTIGAAQGNYPGQANMRDTELHIQNVFPMTQAWLNGVGLDEPGAHYDGRSLIQVVTLRGLSTDQDHVVRLRFPATATQMFAKLNGRKGEFRRLADLAERAKTASARDDWAATLPDGFHALVETPTLIDYRPDDVQTIIATFDRNIGNLVALLSDAPEITSTEAERLGAYMVRTVPDPETR